MPIIRKTFRRTDKKRRKLYMHSYISSLIFLLFRIKYMEANVYFFAALVSTGIFLLQFILSIFFGSMDTDIDVNADGNADIDMSSVLSFKGLIHFCMGFGWFMYLCQPPYIVLHYLGAVISGSFFVFVLAWIYKLCYKLKQENKPEQGEELIGRKCEIYTRCQEQEQAGTNYVVYIAINGAQRELTVRSIQGKSYREGDILTLKDYKEGIYYID